MITNREVNYFKKLQKLIEKVFVDVFENIGTSRKYANMISLQYQEIQDSTELLVTCDYVVGYINADNEQYEAIGSFTFETDDHEEFIKLLITKSIAQLTFKLF